MTTDSPLKRVKTNFLRLLKGRGASALLTLAATALMARSLSPDYFGLVVLIHTYLLAVRGLLNLKPFEAIIRYGITAQEEGRTDRLVQLLRMILVLDVIFALVGTLITLSLVPLVGPLLGWNSEAQSLALLYSLLMLSACTGAANGVLRLHNRFDLLGLRQAMGPLVQLLGVALAWLLKADYPYFLLAYGLGWLVENLAMLWFGWRESCRQLGNQLWKGPIWQQHRERFPGFWHFIQVVYWQANTDLIPKQISLLGVGALLGAADAGLFRLAQQLAKVLTVPALLLRTVLFPDLARLWHRKDPQFAGIIKRSLVVAVLFGGAVALLSLFLGEPAIQLLAGPEYLGAVAVIFWLMFSAGLDLGLASLRAAGYAMGFAGVLLRLYLTSLAGYVLLFLVLGQWLGLAGIGMATAGWSALNLLLVGGLVWHKLRLGAQGPL